MPAAFRVWPGVGLLPALADSPQQREAVCRLHAGLRMLLLVPRASVATYLAAEGGGGSAGGAAADVACPPSAAAFVVLWFQLASLLAPLAVVYVIELRAKGAFLRARGLRPNIETRIVALCMGPGLVYLTHVVWIALPYFASPDLAG
jgi:hypothetical protein